MQERPVVAAIAASTTHNFCKESRTAIQLIAGRGVWGDTHCGSTVQHLYDKAKNALRPNLRQVHLVEMELIERLQTLGFEIDAGDLGENVTTRNLKLIELGAGTQLKLGKSAIIKITGLRSPCVKIERFRNGLRRAVTDHRDGQAFMKSSVMAAVIRSGTIQVGDDIEVARGTHSRMPLRPI